MVHPLRVMRKVQAVWFVLLLAWLPSLAVGQSKRFACSFAHPKAGEGGFLPEYVPVEICTDVIFKWFHFPQFVGRQMLFNDNDKIAFSRLVTSVRQRSSTSRVVASIDGTGIEFSTVSGTNVRRRAFVQAISVLLLELDADAIELNWGSPGSENSGTGIATDRLTMVTLLQDLRQVVNAASGFIKGRTRELWIRGSIHPNLISTSYNTFDVCDLVDFVTLSSTSSGSIPPLYSKVINLPSFAGLRGGPTKIGNGLIDTTQEWIDNGCPPKKLLLGLGFRGILKSLPYSTVRFFGDDLLEGGTNGVHMDYRELCQSIRQRGWSVGWDQQRYVASASRYQNGQSERLLYEDVNSLRYKMDLIEQKRLGGVFVDYIHSDDIYGSCGQPYPLSGYVASRLQAIPSDIGFAIEWS